MVDKAQKRAQKARRKEEKRRKERVRDRNRQVKSVQNRLDVRIAKQSTQPWVGEALEDRAVFDDAALATLQGEAAEHVACVRQALEEVVPTLSGPSGRRACRDTTSQPDGRLANLVAWPVKLASGRGCGGIRSLVAARSTTSPLANRHVLDPGPS